MQLSTAFINGDDATLLTHFRGTWPEICKFALQRFPHAIIYKCDGRETRMDPQKPDVCVGPVFTYFSKPVLVRQVAFAHVDQDQESESEPDEDLDPVAKYPTSDSGWHCGRIAWRAILFAGLVTVFTLTFTFQFTKHG